MATIRRSPARRRAVEYAGLALSLIVLAAGLVVVVVRPVTATQFATLHPLAGTVEVGRGTYSFSVSAGDDAETLREDDSIRTGATGIAEVVFFDGSVTRLDPETTVTLERVAHIPKAPDSRLIELELERGRTFHHVPNVSDPDSHFRVTTGHLAAAAAGSSFVLSALADGGQAVWVLPDADPTAGLVALDAEGAGVQLQEGEGTTVSRTGSPGTPFRLTDYHLKDAWVIHNLCQLDQADVAVCRPTFETSTLEKEPLAEPAGTQAGAKKKVELTTAVPNDVVPTALPARVALFTGTRGVSDARRAKFRFGTADPFGSFECSLDGGSFRPCTSPQRFRGLSDGTHLFLVRAVDPSGTAGPVARRRWRIDTAAPETLLTAPSLALGGSQALFSFASSERRSAFECGLDAGPFLTCASPKNYAGLGPGAHTFQVRAVDRAGNVDPTPAAYSWTVDGVVVVPVPLMQGGRASTVAVPGSAGAAVVADPNPPVSGNAGRADAGRADADGAAPVTTTAEPSATIGPSAVVESTANDAVEEVSSLLPSTNVEPLEEAKEVSIETAGGLVSSLLGT